MVTARFQSKVNYPGCTVGSALKIVLADFNRDGNTDIALGCSDRKNDNISVAGFTGNGGLVILLGNGDGSFQTPVFYSTGDVASIATGDFNSDGLLDIALPITHNRTSSFFSEMATEASLRNRQPLRLPVPRHGVVVADFNGDGIDDVAYAVESPLTIRYPTFTSLLVTAMEHSQCRPLPLQPRSASS